MCMAPSPTEKIPGLEVKMKPQACPGKVWRASLGDVGGPNGLQMDLFRATLGSKWPRGGSKRPSGIERRRAPNVTHSVVWRTCVSKSIRITVYFEHNVTKRKWDRNWGAPNVTHSVISCTLVPLSISCCDKFFAFFIILQKSHRVALT